MAQAKHRFTPEEYLALDRASDTKHEFFEGEVYDMVGGKPNHNIVSGNVFASLYNQLLDHVTSLQEYLLVFQDQPQIDHYSRTSETSWIMQEVSGIKAAIDLPSIGCTLALSDVYRKVTFDETEAE